MLRHHKDPSTLAAAVKMTRADHDGTLSLVEGVDDIRFWGTRRHSTCELVDGEGKTNVLGSIHRLDSEPGVLGIVDDDYDSLTGTHHATQNIVATDAHDLECLLCRSTALDKVLAQCGARAKIRSFEEQVGVDTRTSLLAKSLVFGRLRWATTYFALGIDLTGVSVERFMDRTTWTVREEDLLRTVTRAGGSTQYSLLRQSISSLPAADPWRVANGHDMVRILRIGLLQVLGTLKTNVDANQVARVLRAAIAVEELHRTGFGAAIRAWEANNAPYRVFRH